VIEDGFGHSWIAWILLSSGDMPFPEILNSRKIRIEVIHTHFFGLKVLFFCSAVDKNVVKVNNDKLIEKMSQDLVHHAHESAWSIRKAEWRNDPLEKAFFGFESRFSIHHRA
jgi:hypothetical protein